MAISSDPQRRHRAVLKKFGSLLELKGDIDRNESDRNFLDGADDPQNPRRIYYVFDENVFELFLDPSAQPSYCENFYAPVWSPRSPVKGKRYSAQAGLIAGEYLFSQGLPGRLRGDPIFLTKWHYLELQRRVRRLDRTLRRNAAELGSASAPEFAEASRMAALSREVTTKRELDKLLKLADSDVRADIRRFLSAENDLPAAVRALLARELTSRLTADRILEPLHQLRRYYAEILSRIRPLNSQFEIEDREQAAFKALIGEWVSNLSDSYGDQAEDGRINYDARSVAYVQWVAQHKLTRDERIVLVTGDGRLLDAYRQVYRYKDVGEPFLLRSVNQYAPLINPHELPNDINPDVGERHLFKSLSVAMEAPIQTFDIARRIQGREHFAAHLRKAKEPETHTSVRFFTFRLSEEWWLHRERGFAQLSDQWRDAERLAIGTSLPILGARLKRRQELLNELHSEVADNDAGEAFGRYLSRLLEDITYRGMQIDLPDAVGFVATETKAMAAETPRAPMLMRLRIPIARDAAALSTIDFSDLLEALTNDDPAALEILDQDRNAALRGRPDLLFAVSAALALRIQYWEQAERFAENALKAAQTLHLQSAPPTESLRSTPVATHEYGYLLVLARRFVTGTRRPSAVRRPRDPWIDDLEASLEELKALEVEAAYANDAFRTLRALGERVAIRLSYASWGVTVARATLEQCGYDMARGKAELALSVRDIRAAWTIAAEAEAEAEADGDGVGALLQTLSINAAAAALIGWLADRTSQHFSDPELEILENEATSVAARAASFPKIVSVDVLAFLTLVRGRSECAEDLRALLREKATETELERIEIDRALSRAVLHALAPPGRGG